MFVYNDSSALLRILGTRLRAARISRGDPQKAFAYRIGVSVPTLRDLESGKPTVSMGAFINALNAVGRINDMNGVLGGLESERKRAKKARPSLP